MTEQRRWTTAVTAFPAFVLAAIVLAACGQAQSPEAEPGAGQAAQTATPPQAAMAGPGDSGSDSGPYTAPDTDAPSAPEATLALSTTAAAETGSVADSAGAAAEATVGGTGAEPGGGPGAAAAGQAEGGADTNPAGTPAAAAGAASAAGAGDASADSAPAAAPDAVAAAPGDPSSPTRPEGWQPADPATHPLSIERLRRQAYPGSDLVVVEELPAGSNYRRQVVSYESEGNTIYGLYTVPNGERPATGWPVVIFNHGYIPPAQYRTTQRYVAYQDAFARAGYITLKSDYRGHGSSEGDATSGRGSPAYTIDVLNGMASVLRHPEADPNRVGMWGHSMGGSITLRAMVLDPRIKAGVIWAGVVASYEDMYNRLGSPAGGNPNPNASRRGWRNDLIESFGTPEENPEAWDAVSPNAYLTEISGPLQLHHGSNDHSVPLAYSERLQEQMQAAGRPSEIFVYPGDDHNIAGNLSTALQRSVAFFDQHVKGAAPGG